MSTVIPILTTTLGATPKLAEKVSGGLASGTFERVGGVIRDASTKRVVTFLRDATVGGASNSSALSALGPLLPLNAAASVLNLSITAVGFVIVMQRLQVVEQRLTAISRQLEAIDRKIDLGHFANLRAAIELVRTAFAMTSESNRRVAATQAINRLLEVEHVYLGLLDTEFDDGGWAVPPLLSSVMLACVSASRCYLELGEMATARCHLVDGISAIEPCVSRHYDTVVGVNPAIYLHPKLADQITLVRMTSLHRWMRPALTEAQVFENLRQPLWEAAGPNADSWMKNLPTCLWRQEDGEKKLGPVRRRCSNEEIFERLLPRLPDAFGQVEESFETLGRVRGFEAELDFLLANNISYKDWQSLKTPASSADDSLVCLVPHQSPLVRRPDTRQATPKLPGPIEIVTAELVPKPEGPPSAPATLRRPGL